MNVAAAPSPQPRTPAEVVVAWHAIKAEKNLRNREAAQALGMSEGELIAAACGSHVTRLSGDFRELLKQLEPAGDVMALTRNEGVVHEKTGTYRNVSWDGHVGLALDEKIDLRLFFSQWKHGFAATEESPRGDLRSLQFYDATGTAVHKIYVRPATDRARFEAVVDAFRAEDQSPGIVTEAAKPLPLEKPDAEIDVDGFREAWTKMQDTHDFFGLLRKFGVTRTQALRLAPAEFAYRVPADAPRTLLQDAAASGLPIMVFVGSPGCIQIHTGPVQNIQVMGPWLNVMDEGFNLHFREDHVAAAWVVKKPTVDGIVTALETFDAAGNTLAQFFGKRKPGVPELENWRTTVARLPAVAE